MTKYSVEFSLRTEQNEGLKPLPEDYAADYSLAYWINYTETEVENPNDCSDCSGICWTYTFTNEDFEVAKVWSEKVQ